MATGSLVFDSWALLAMAQNGPAARKVQALIEVAHQRWATTVNLGEVWYSLARRRSEMAAEIWVTDLVVSAGFQVAPADWTLTREAARLKASYTLSYADCFAAALARRENASLVTGDREFRPLRGEVSIRWL